MSKTIFFNGFKVLLILGVLFSLSNPHLAMAKTPAEPSLQQNNSIMANTKPVANADNYTTAADTVLTVPAPGVLTNDYDADGDPLTAHIVGPPAYGSLALNSNGSFTYTPDGVYTGDVHWTYKVHDGTVYSNPVMNTITVTGGGNTAPVTQEDNYTTSYTVTLTVPAPGVLTNDVDAEGDPLTAWQTSPAAHGTATLYTDGHFVYVPDGEWIGSDHFTYQAYDGTAYSLTTVVNIVVTGGANTAPEANADDYTTPNTTTLTVPAVSGVLANDHDADADVLSADLLISPVNGNLVFNEADGSFAYTPDANYIGDDHFTYRAYDGTEYSNPALVTINVTGINSAPVAVADTYTTTMDTTLTVAAPGVLANDTDPNENPLTAQLVGSPPACGTLNFVSDGSFTYIPADDYVGQCVFTYKAYDGTSYSDPVAVTIDVQAINTAPVAVADDYVMLMNTTLTVGASSGLLANDTDADSDPLTAELQGSPPPTQGTVTVNPDGSFTFVPVTNYYGQVIFTYVANDGIEDSMPVQVTINVKQSNMAPTAVEDYYTVESGATLTVNAADGVLDNDTDPNSDVLDAHLVTNVAHGTLTLHDDGSFIYVSTSPYVGVDTFTYHAFDGLASSADVVVTINVTGLNVAPVASPDAYSIGNGATLTVNAASGVLDNDTDANGNALTAQLVTGASHGTLALHSDGSFVYTSVGYVGEDTFTYRAFDGSLYSEAVVVTITVTNILPVASPDLYTALSGFTLTISAPGVLGNDTDANNNALTAVLVTGVSNGSLTLNSDGSFVYTSNIGFVGQDSFTYQAFDGFGNSVTVTVTINVTAVASQIYMPLTLR